MHVAELSGRPSAQANRASRVFLLLTAWLVAFGQPLAALAFVDACERCEHEALDGSDCCCAPAPPEAAPLAVAEEDEGCCAESEPEQVPQPAIEDACCAEPVAAPDLRVEPGCSCRSVPECPTAPPLPLPPTQDISAAGEPARLLDAAVTISARSIAGFAPDLLAPLPRGDLEPTAPDAGNRTRLVRAAVQGTPALLSLLSVARL